MIKIKKSITKMKTLKIKINNVNFKGSGEKRWIGSDTSNKLYHLPCQTSPQTGKECYEHSNNITKESLFVHTSKSFYFNLKLKKKINFFFVTN
jgi:hypothetical protein